MSKESTGEVADKNLLATICLNLSDITAALDQGDDLVHIAIAALAELPTGF